MNKINTPLANKISINSRLISLESMDFTGKLNLRIKSTDIEAHSKISQFLTYDLPLKVGGISTNNQSRVACMGPDEYLIQCPNERKIDFFKNLGETLQGSFYALTDVSDYYLTIRLSGIKSIDVIQKGCPLNFKEYLNKKDTCAQSYISKATVLIDRLADDKVFDILVRWSMAEYLWSWLEDSSLEFSE